MAQRAKKCYTVHCEHQNYKAECTPTHYRVDPRTLAAQLLNSYSTQKSTVAAQPSTTQKHTAATLAGLLRLRATEWTPNPSCTNSKQLFCTKEHGRGATKRTTQEHRVATIAGLHLHHSHTVPKPSASIIETKRHATLFSRTRSRRNRSIFSLRKHFLHRNAQEKHHLPTQTLMQRASN